MLKVSYKKIGSLLFSGGFGLEKESLRIDEKGFMAHTPHPFPTDNHIIRDFCENQVEIITPVTDSPIAAVEALSGLNCRLQKHLSEMTPREYQWPFSSPPYIKEEADIPVRTDPEDPQKAAYVKYIERRYGRYKMTFSGIHVNFSFSDELLQKDFSLSAFSDFTAYKNNLYLTLAKRLAAYGWILVALTAASPFLDSSFFEKGRIGEDTFIGMTSMRCSEGGFWNSFSPVFDYTSLAAYTAGIERYVKEGWISAASELYYPIRLKPKGINTLESLVNGGIDHIELRMFDLNPLVLAGVEWRDVAFAHLLMIWLVATPDQPFSPKDQINAVQNFKNAAHYDLETVRLVLPNGEFNSMPQAALKLIGMMREYFADAPEEVQEVLQFEEDKFLSPQNRYSRQIRRDFSGGFVKKGVELAKKQQEMCLHV